MKDSPTPEPARSRELVNYNVPQLPLYVKKDRLSGYPNRSAIVHWHKDIELIVILNGEMTYSVNGTEYGLVRGGGIFINSGQFHYGYSKDGGDCEFICVVMPLSIPGQLPYIRENYVRPLILSRDCPCFLLESAAPSGLSVIQEVKRLYDAVRNQEKEYELTAASLCLDIWKYLYRLAMRSSDAVYGGGRHVRELQDMLLYIQEHYTKTLTLDQVARAGGVCRSGCCRIFRELLHRSPAAYIKDYRIARSLEHLERMDMNITEIALCCGFSDTSYYIRTFRRAMGCTPLQYQKRLNLYN